MYPTVPAIVLAFSRTATAMCAAGIALFLIGLWASRSEIASARALDKVVALSNVCYAVPLAVFGALHLYGPQFVQALVPSYMPGRMFWVYFVGCALLAASLSIATRIAVRWSGLLVGIMMFLFVALLYLPSALRHLHARITWTIVFRELSFGGAGWIFAAIARPSWSVPLRGALLAAGRFLISMAAIFFGIQHFLHPHGLPVVPLQKQMPAWLPAQVLIDCVTGVALLLAGLSFLLTLNVRRSATYLGTWILFLLLVIYLPVMISALSTASIDVQVEGINYFADTLLFAGVILSQASAIPPTQLGKRKIP